MHSWLKTTCSRLPVSHIQRKASVWKENRSLPFCSCLCLMCPLIILTGPLSPNCMFVHVPFHPFSFILIRQTLLLLSMQPPTSSSSLFSTQWTFFSRSYFNLFLLCFLPHFFLPMVRSHTTFTHSSLPARLLSSPSARLSQLYFSAHFLDSLICLLLLGCIFFSMLYFSGAGPLLFLPLPLQCISSGASVSTFAQILYLTLSNFEVQCLSWSCFLVQ